MQCVPRPNRVPSQRRPQIEKLLLEGKTFKQIAIKLQLVYGTVLWYAQEVYKQHGVRSVRAAGGPAQPPPAGNQKELNPPTAGETA